MKKELIIRNTIIFLITCLSTVISGRYLGSDNLIVGVFVFIISLFILNKNFTGSPLKIAMKIISLTLFIGIFPYIANLNIYTGIFVNFFAIFIMLYLLVYSFKETIYFPFLLGYTLFLSSNPAENQFPLRVLGLSLIGIGAFLVQLFINRKKAKSLHIYSLKNMINSLEDIINKRITKSDYESSIKSFKNSSTLWNNTIFENRDNTFYLSEKENVELNIISSFEKLENQLEKVEITKDNIYILTEIKKVISIFKDEIEDKIHYEELNERIHQLHCKAKELKPNSYLLYELIESLYIINSLLQNLINLCKTKENKLKVNEIKRERKDFIKLFISNLNKNSVRFTFAFRTALLLSICYFIVEYFHIKNGDWMLYSISTVSQLYDDNVKLRGLHRIKGTFIGAITFFFLFSIFPQEPIRLIIILIAVYIAPFMKSYDKTMIFMTILILGLASMSSADPRTLTIDRIVYSIIGVIIAYIGSKLILHYNIEKETKILIDKYYNLGNNAIERVLSITSDTEAKTKFKNDILLAPIIENKLLLSNSALNNEKLKLFIKEERTLLNSLNYIISRVEYADITLKENRNERLNNLKTMSNELENLYVSCNNCADKFLIEAMKHHFENIEKMNEKLIYVTFCEIILSNKKCLELKKEILTVLN